jgi:hypothetical protein
LNEPLAPQQATLMTRLFAAPIGGRLAAVLAILVLGPQVAWGQLRVVTYNTTGGLNSNLEIVLRAIGEEQVNGIAKPIDVLLLQEQNTPSSDTQTFVNYLNTIYGAGTYSRGSAIGGPPTSSIRQTIVYNTQTVDLLAENAFGNTVGGPDVAQERQTLRYRLEPDGYDSAAQFYAYNSHYRAGTTADDQSQRQVEATSIRTNASFGSDALGEGAHAIFVGDYNMQSSSEAAFQTLIAAGAGQANDPVNSLGTWHDNLSLAFYHTQSPCSSGCGAGGGVDDRFDFQLVTGEFLDDEGLSVIPGSYHTFGNNGTTLNMDINNASNTYVFTGVTTYTKPQILNALRNGTDHLPVVVDYQIPAILEAIAGSVPATLDLGEVFNLDVTVSNDAPVMFANGADELDYSLTTSGDVSGSFLNQMDAALGSGNTHLVALDTSTPGMKSGMITITSASQGVQNGLVNIPISFQVLGPPTIPGDYNDDGTVDAGDYVVWRANEGTNNTLPNDPHGGTIGAAQYDEWTAHFGETAPGSGSLGAVPEPGSALLLIVGVCLAGLARGRLRG